MIIGAALVALSALGQSTNPILGKYAYQQGANAVTLMAIRFSVAAVGLWAVFALRRELPGIGGLRRLQLLSLGGLGMAMVSLLYFAALEHIGAALATGLVYTYPAFVAVIGMVRGEGITRAGLAGLALTAAGMWLMPGTDLGGFTWGGALLILGSAAIYALYIVVGDAWTRGIPTFTTAMYVTTGAAAVCLAAVAATRPGAPGAGAYLAGSGLALFSTVLAMVSFFAGLPKVGPTRAAIISMLEPVFTALLAALLLHERLSGLQLVGIVLIIGGAVSAQQRSA